MGGLHSNIYEGTTFNIESESSQRGRHQIQSNVDARPGEEKGRERSGAQEARNPSRDSRCACIVAKLDRSIAKRCIARLRILVSVVNFSLHNVGRSSDFGGAGRCSVLEDGRHDLSLLRQHLRGHGAQLLEGAVQGQGAPARARLLQVPALCRRCCAKSCGAREWRTSFKLEGSLSGESW